MGGFTLEVTQYSEYPSSMTLSDSSTLSSTTLCVRWALEPADTPDPALLWFSLVNDSDLPLLQHDFAICPFFPQA
jgi:hypothetical protein